MNRFDIRGNKAVVTGGASGLGLGMAEGLLEAGAEVVIMDVSQSLSEVVEDFCKKGFSAHGITVDLQDKDERVKAFDEAVGILGNRLDILIPAAGIQKRHKSEQFPLQDWQDVLDINLTAVFVLCQLAGKVMLSQGYGKIINIASMFKLLWRFYRPSLCCQQRRSCAVNQSLIE